MCNFAYCPRSRPQALIRSNLSAETSLAPVTHTRNLLKGGDPLGYRSPSKDKSPGASFMSGPLGVSGLTLSPTRQHNSGWVVSLNAKYLAKDNRKADKGEHFTVKVNTFNLPSHPSVYTSFNVAEVCSCNLTIVGKFQ